jgi:L-ascorbate metabolism protein UlaG (beta-lactamase superfamily)
LDDLTRELHVQVTTEVTIETVEAIPTRSERGAGRTELGMQFLGHSTLLIEMDGVRVLTDPFLRGWIGPLRRHGPHPDDAARHADAVVISHAHLDHLDVPSLRRLVGQPIAIVPAGLGFLIEKAGLRNVVEVRPGDRVTVGDLEINVFPALHDGFRPPLGPTAPAIGFVFEGSARVYFAGDTDIFPGLEDLAGNLDVALLPVWGWGPYLGSGHMDPGRAALAARLLAARLTIPIHWGALFPRGFHHVWPDRLHRPPRDFARILRDLGADLDVRILEPGDRIVFS